MKQLILIFIREVLIKFIGACLKNTYNSNELTWLNEDVVKALKIISSRKECCVIIWSSCHENYIPRVKELFKEHGIRIGYFNENPEISNTTTGCFDDKFYFSIGVDDKFGFDPENEWKVIIDFYSRVL